VGALVALKEEGKIRHIGISNVDEHQIREAQRLTPVVSVQNRYNLRDRHSDVIVDLCEQEQIVFLPWAPIQDADDDATVRGIASKHGITPRQLMLAWLLARSPMMLPIPGTASRAHLEDNIAAASVRLDPAEVAQLSA
jgi:aryl-alcohol dehydrogenase-like predicted oxidoreductase